MKHYTVSLHCVIESHCISYLKHIIEAYDNIAVISTIDSIKGVISVSFSLSCEGLVMSIIEDLSDTIKIKLIDRKLLY